jgi:predicted DNA-binding transcriptional regulator YafY
MPANKNALIRYRVINRCLLKAKRASFEELRSACEKALDIYPIGDRTIAADIHAMRYDEELGYNAPIKMDTFSKVYYYEDPDYSIDKIPLGEDEQESLIFAARLLSEYKEIEIFSTFSETVEKIVQAVNVYRQTKNDVSTSFIQFEKNSLARGTKYLEPLITATRNRQVIKVDYKSFTSQKTKTHIIHPYYLKEYRGRWYLIGHNDIHSGIRTYSLDRIMGVHKENTKRFKDVGFDPQKYYENVIGVSVVDENPIEIQIAFSELQAQYVITQPLHHSQTLVSESENKIIFKYFIIPNFEFFSQILAWGNEVEVIKPEAIRKSIKLNAESILQIYRVVVI